MAEALNQWFDGVKTEALAEKESLKDDRLDAYVISSYDDYSRRLTGLS